MRFLAACLILAFASAAQAQQRARVPTIGVISMGMEPSSPPLAAFRQGLREHGYVEGKNIKLEYRFAEGHADRLPGLAAELVRLNPDVIVTEGTPTALAVNQATKTIPVVMAFGADPVKAGLVASFARPGGNITGVVGTGAQRTLKQLELLKESVPAARTVGVIYNPTRPDTKEFLEGLAEAARVLRVELVLVPASNPDELNAAFKAVASARPGGLITIGHGMLYSQRKRIVDFALKNRLPGVFPEREFVDDGGLMSYGPDIPANFRRAASYVDRILKGAKPADLPIEQPSTWHLVVNLRTAKALGLKIPGTVLVRADEVIQ